MKSMVVLGRIFFAAIFLTASLGHFSAQTIQFAASQGLPLASIAVPPSGVLALLGGLSIALGYKARYGAWMLVLFLVPVTAMMHNFWTVGDPMLARIQQAMFMQNLALVGGAFLLTYFGSGPVSLDSVLKTRRARLEEAFRESEHVVA